MARWKVFVSLTVEATRQNVSKFAAFRRGRSLGAKISGGRGRPWRIFLVSTKLDTFCYLIVQTTPCYVPSFWHNTGVWQTDGRTDGQTDGRNCLASTALAMQALRRAVKNCFVNMAITTTTILRPFFWDHPGEVVPEKIFWTLWCKGRLTEADIQTIRLGPLHLD